MDEEIIERTIRKFARRRCLAKKCGFGLVTVHAVPRLAAASVSLSPKTNTRKINGGARTMKTGRVSFWPFVTQFAKQWVPGFPMKYGSAARSAMGRRL
jgi:hypothetical protein